MAKIYTELTDMLDVIQQDDAGEWIIDRENDGTPEHPMESATNFDGENRKSLIPYKKKSMLIRSSEN